MKALFTACLALAALAAVSEATSILWTGYANNGQWNSPTNWYPAQVPGAEDDVTIHIGTVQATTFVSVNSLLMGDQLAGTANLTIFNGFNVFQQMQVYQNGQVSLTSGASNLNGVIVIQGSLVFSSGSVQGTITVTGSANLGGSAAKTLNACDLSLNGPSTIGGTVTLRGQGSNLTIRGSSQWTGVNLIATHPSSVFTATRGAVSISADTLLQANGTFGALSISNGANVTISSNVVFSNTVAIPSNTFVTTIGTAVISTTLSGTGTFTSSGSLTTFGAQTFGGIIGAFGPRVVFTGSGSVNNLVASTGVVDVIAGAKLAASILSIQSATVNGAGTLTAGQLNLLGAGVVRGAIQSNNLYATSSNVFTLNGQVWVATAANIGAITFSFGPSGVLRLRQRSQTAVTGALSLTGAPGAAVLELNGNIAVSGSIVSNNINVDGTGSVNVTGSISVSGAKLGGGSVSLSRGGSIRGTNACIRVGTLWGNTISARIGAFEWTATGSITNVMAACNPLPTTSFRFTA
jgi:hypothetical protein